MPRSPRPATGGIVTDVPNRSNARRPPFEHDGDYEPFEHTLEQAHARTAVRILPCCVMPNHSQGNGVRNLLWPGRRFSLAFCPALDRVMPCPGHPGPRQPESSRTS